MKNSRPSNAGASALSESFHRRLGMYAVAASAAGVSAVAMALPAEAKIVYTPAHVKIGFGGVTEYKLDLNHDGKYDFVISTRFGLSTGALEAAAPNSSYVNRVATVRNQHGLFAAALIAGKQIGPGGNSSVEAPLVVDFFHSDTSTYTFGPWKNIRNRYLGLKFKYKGKTHYGWARLSVTVAPHREITATLTGYAYETIPNKPIITGQTSADGISRAIPALQPASLGTLAKGASGLSTWRK